MKELLTSNSWSKFLCSNFTMNRYVISWKMIIRSFKFMKIKIKEYTSRILAWILSLLLTKWTKNWKKEVIIDILVLLIWIKSHQGHIVSLWLEFNSNRLLMDSQRLRLESLTLSIWQDLKGRKRLRQQEVVQRKVYTSIWLFLAWDRLSKLWYLQLLVIFLTEIQNWQDCFNNLWEEMQRQSWLLMLVQLIITMTKQWAPWDMHHKPRKSRISQELMKILKMQWLENIKRKYRN